MNPKPKLSEEYKRSERVQIQMTKQELELLDELVVAHGCRDRSDYIRKAAFGKIKVDRKKLKQD